MKRIVKKQTGISEWADNLYEVESIEDLPTDIRAMAAILDASDPVVVGMAKERRIEGIGFVLDFYDDRWGPCSRYYYLDCFTLTGRNDNEQEGEG